MNENETKTNEAKLTIKERLKKIPVKKVLKVVGIGAGAVIGTMILGKVLNPKDEYYQELEEVPFDEGTTDAES